MTDGRQAVDFVLRRHSAREFTGEPVAPEDVDVLMEALRSAPSAGNMQPWFFYVVAKREVRTGLATAAYRQHFIEHAPLVFVVQVPRPRPRAVLLSGHRGRCRESAGRRQHARLRRVLGRRVRRGRGPGRARRSPSSPARRPRRRRAVPPDHPLPRTPACRFDLRDHRVALRRSRLLPWHARAIRPQ